MNIRNNTMESFKSLWDQHPVAAVTAAAGIDATADHDESSGLQGPNPNSITSEVVSVLEESFFLRKPGGKNPAVDSPKEEPQPWDRSVQKIGQLRGGMALDGTTNNASDMKVLDPVTVGSETLILGLVGAIVVVAVVGRGFSSKQTTRKHHHNRYSPSTGKSRDISRGDGDTSGLDGSLEELCEPLLLDGDNGSSNSSSSSNNNGTNDTNENEKNSGDSSESSSAKDLEDSTGNFRDANRGDVDVDSSSSSDGSLEELRVESLPDGNSGSDNNNDTNEIKKNRENQEVPSALPHENRNRTIGSSVSFLVDYYAILGTDSAFGRFSDRFIDQMLEIIGSSATPEFLRNYLKDIKDLQNAIGERCLPQPDELDELVRSAERRIRILEAFPTAADDGNSLTGGEPARTASYNSFDDEAILEGAKTAISNTTSTTTNEELKRRMEWCERIKKKANARFNQADVVGARALYNLALDLLSGFLGETETASTKRADIGEAGHEPPHDDTMRKELEKTVAILYSNRAVTFYRERFLQPSLEDCDKSLALNPKDEKTYIRKWRTLDTMGERDQAMACLEEGIRELPQSEKLSKELREYSATPPDESGNGTRGMNSSLNNHVNFSVIDVTGRPRLNYTYERANRLKKQANAKFNKRDIDGARVTYTDALLTLQALEPNPDCGFRSQDTKALRSELYSNRAVTHYMNKNYWESLADCELSIEMRKENEKSYIRKARALVGLERNADAKECLEDAQKLFPSSIKIEKELFVARARVMYGDVDVDGLACLQQGAETTPAGRALAANIYDNRSIGHFREKRFRDCVNDCDKTFEFDKKHEKSYIRKWRSLMALGDFDDSVESLRSALVELPESARLNEELANAIKEKDLLGNVDQMIARHEYQKAHKILEDIVNTSNNIILWCLFARVCSCLGKTGSAIDIVEKVLMINSKNVEGLRIKGLATFLSRDMEQGVKLLEESLDCVTENKANSTTSQTLLQCQQTMTTFRKGQAWVADGRYGEAVDLFTSAMNQGIEIPHHSPLYSMLLTERAEANLLSEQPHAALEDCTEAISLKEDNLSAWAVKIEVYHALGRPQEALDEIGMARKAWAVPASILSRRIQALKGGCIDLSDINETSTNIKVLIPDPKVTQDPDLEIARLKRWQRLESTLSCTST